ncbi:MAG: site-2 protease family protein [Planctomycetaceae bacterium]
MNHRQSPIYWSIPCGKWANTDVRMSVFMPLLFVLICVKLGDLRLGIAVSLIFLISTLIHEMAHIFAVRQTGGSGDEILLWPLGGLAMVYPAGSFRSQFLTPAAGPLANLAICLLVALPVMQSPQSTAVFYPFELPIGALSTETLRDLFVLMFWLNWLLLLVNLLPVYPLDGGRMLQAVLSRRFGGEDSKRIYLKVGLFVGFGAFVVGMFVDEIWIVAISAMVLLLNMQEYFQMQSSEAYDDSFLGYDFSQGYTSLERSLEDAPAPAKQPGVLARWRERRRTERERQEQERDAQVQAELDHLLEKIQQHGMDSLTDAERRNLQRASALFRDKYKPASLRRSRLRVPPPPPPHHRRTETCNSPASVTGNSPCCALQQWPSLRRTPPTNRAKSTRTPRRNSPRRSPG